jgi:AcrR family transcriptional regulator
MDAPSTTLRERQARQVRTAVLEATIAALEASNVADVAMADIAAAAGISLRTLYRHFPDRASLLQAAGDHLYASLGVPFKVQTAGQLAQSFREAARRLSARPKLSRALVKSSAGLEARSRVRRERLDAIQSALAPLTADLDAAFGRRATAVLAHLCSAASWVSIADESELSDAEAQEAAGWAIEVLVRSLQEDADRSVLRTRRNRDQKRSASHGSKRKRD